jgi:hypothetical protein
MAGTEVRANPIELTRLADEMLRSSQRIADAWQTAQTHLHLRPGVWGVAPADLALADRYAGAVDDADVMIGRLIGVIEDDVDRLYRVAFAYQKADDDAAGRIPVTPV